MQRFSTTAAVLFVCVTVWPGVSIGQDALDRLEERLRAEQAPKIPAPQGAPADRRAGQDLAGGPEPGYLGVLADDRFEQGRGIRVLEVIAGGPAENGGLRPRDIINRVNGQPARSQDELIELLSPMPPGTKVRIGVERAAEQIDVEVTLGERPPPGERRFGHFGPIDDDLALPEPLEEPRRRHLLGVRCSVLTDQARRVLGTPALQGAVVVEITPGSPADLAGIPAEAVIVGVSGQPVTRPSDLNRLVLEAGAGNEIELEYYSRRTLFRKKVVLAEAAPPELPEVDRPRPAEADPRVAQLEQRVQLLERRLADIEAMLQELLIQRRQNKPDDADKNPFRLLNPQPSNEPGDADEDPFPQ